MDSKLVFILMLITIIVLLIKYNHTKIITDGSCNGKWMGGVVVLVQETEDPNSFNLCYHNKDNHITIPCRATNVCGNIIKIYFVNNTHLPYIADNCISMVYDKLNDVLVYRGKNIKDSIFDESKFRYRPDEVFVVVGRNNLQVIHNWSGVITNSIRVNGHLLQNVSEFHENGYLQYLDEVLPRNNLIDESGYFQSIKNIKQGNEILYVPDCNTNLMDSMVYVQNEMYKASIYTNQCQGPWLGGSLNIKQINEDSYEFCNLEGDGCIYARAENNRFILSPSNDLYLGNGFNVGYGGDSVKQSINQSIKDNRICNSLYYCKDNDVFVWYGDPCLKNYSDLDNKINSDIYMVIGRKQLIFYIGNIEAVNNASPSDNLLPYIYNPKDILVRPYM
jgi:hypothetical protein